LAGLGPQRARAPWREPIDEWFATIAGDVAAHAGFQFGIIGFEVSGMDWQYDGTPPTATGVSYLVAEASAVKHIKPTPWIGG
jgi:hypothetical protein